MLGRKQAQPSSYYVIVEGLGENKDTELNVQGLGLCVEEKWGGIVHRDGLIIIPAPGELHISYLSVLLLLCKRCSDKQGHFPPVRDSSFFLPKSMLANSAMSTRRVLPSAAFLRLKRKAKKDPRANAQSLRGRGANSRVQEATAILAWFAMYGRGRIVTGSIPVMVGKAAGRDNVDTVDSIVCLLMGRLLELMLLRTRVEKGRLPLLPVL